MKRWFVVLALVQLVILSIVGLIRFYLLARMSEAEVANSDYGLFLFCSSIASTVIPFVLGHHIDRGRYRDITLWGMATLSVMALWLLMVPPQSLILIACSFTLVASCVVVAVQLCLKAAVIEGSQNGNLARGNWLNQLILALSLLIPAGVHLLFYGGYEITQLLVVMLLLLLLAGIAVKLQLRNLFNASQSSRQIRPAQVVGILRQHLSQLNNLWYILLLLLMNFATGVLESYAMPKIQAEFGGDGIVYALLAVGSLYFIGSFVSLAIGKAPFISGPAAMYTLILVCCVGMMLAPSMGLLLAVCALFFMLHPHVFILTDSRIQSTVMRDVIGTHFSVLRVASFVMLSLGNLVVSATYLFTESL